MIQERSHIFGQVSSHVSFLVGDVDRLVIPDDTVSLRQESFPEFGLLFPFFLFTSLFSNGLQVRFFPFLLVSF